MLSKLIPTPENEHNHGKFMETIYEQRAFSLRRCRCRRFGIIFWGKYNL